MNRHFFALVSLVFFGAAGCAHLDKLHARLDMTEQHLGSPAPYFYEGKLTATEKFGPMTSLQFSDGSIMDVSKAPAGLAAGDIVRVYHAEKGDEAHLWSPAATNLPSAESYTLAPAILPK